MTERANTEIGSTRRIMDSLAIEIAEASNESIVIYDADGRIVHLNEASDLLYGVMNSEAIGKTAAEMFGASLDEPGLDHIVSKGSWQGIVQRRTADGVPLLVEIRVRSHRDEEDGTDLFIEFGRRADPRIVEGHSIGSQRDWVAVWSIDVSGATTALQKMTHNNGARANHLSGAYPRFVADYLKIKDLNLAAAKLFANEGSPTAVIGKSAYRCWPKNHRDALLDMTLAVLLMTESDIPIVRRIVGADTLTVWRSSAEHPSLISVGVTGSWSDPETYWEIAASEQRYRNLIDNIPLPVWQVDARVMSGVIENLKASGIDDIEDYLAAQPDLVRFASEAVVVTEINDSAMRLFRGHRREDFLQDVSYLFTGTPAAASRVVMAHFAGGRNYSEEMKILTFDGELLDVLFYVTFPQYPEKLDKTLIMIIDVTEQRRIERQLRKIEADFAHAARISALGELVTSIAHEVRQPLSVIVTDADTGIRWLARDEPNLPKVKSIMARIMENAHRANEVIRRIKGMAVKSDPVRDSVDINDIVREAALFVRSESQANHIAITTRLAGGLPRIIGDRVQLQQVVVNLLINGIQAIAANNSRTREISIETGQFAEKITLVVRDSGGGIQANEIDKIFDGFFSRKADGMGMGLAICRSIIGDHGGTISAENDGARGAVFRLTLPIMDSSREVAIETVPR
ncbi:PAS domain-containing sensor histidine kinase [Rhizobium leguminosarum bv. viciae]|nr:PAS domain-containing protein [Rhizobium leguminosarum]NKL82062.1 PAS domain-containing protein [Rhizobium leguminosarum bv. viciae]NEJ47236.1 PAS domain-containing protein [Rhizobium leguminosarum]NEJ50092.1 PAS domain-containing protein [Rhizobium leguminosarum]NKM95886.1 PAS domain-containing protein [Rhizobium leguminosarum bv. viciae]